ncbi:hypothetical protein CAPN002_23740 [Capnocytophaga stomatis]|uniref:hypothetical protein n=1 Tax=Capnocytophaga stomatis TaxID=1848904 RepID=UPI00195003F0|nr:hypothetical protein [Capnocytophaga stomatis]GIJ95156.1 hypothetical protein CAPN002_23740 [Capnocytophaga stomatis]
MKVIVLHNQSLLDTCLQHTGIIESLFDLALANDISVTDDLKAGQEFEVPNNVEKDKDILNYYQAKSIQPATAFSQEDKQVIEKPEGISIWAIHLDFKVS